MHVDWRPRRPPDPLLRHRRQRHPIAVLPMNLPRPALPDHIAIGRVDFDPVAAAPSILASDDGRAASAELVENGFARQGIGVDQFGRQPPGKRGGMVIPEIVGGRLPSFHADDAILC